MKRCKKQWAPLAFTYMIAMVFPTLAWGATHYVSDLCGNDAWTGATVTCQVSDGPKKTIQAAIDVAAEGDTIIVADGTYTGAGNKDLSLGTLNLTVRSANGPGGCTIDCEGDGRAFNINGGQTGATVIDGFTITNGNVTKLPAELGDDKGGGILIWDSSPTINNCTLRENKARDGGGICIAGDELNLFIRPKIIGCLLEGNLAVKWGGGVSFHYFGSCATCPSEIVISGCTIRGNSTADRGYGCGIYLAGGVESVVTIKQSVIADNHCEGINCLGGGISGPDFVDSTIALLNVANCIIAGNAAPGPYGFGGGVSWEGRGVARFADTLITQNTAGAGGAVSCGLVSSSAIVQFYYSDIVGNEATTGGGLYFHGVGGVAGVSVINSSLIRDNEARGGKGHQIRAPESVPFVRVAATHSEISQAKNDVIGDVEITGCSDVKAASAIRTGRKSCRLPRATATIGSQRDRQ